jgi:hypothetical protein
VIKLYGTSGSRANRCLWVLEELGLEYKHAPQRALFQPFRWAVESGLFWINPRSYCRRCTIPRIGVHQKNASVMNDLAGTPPRKEFSV